MDFQSNEQNIGAFVPAVGEIPGTSTSGYSSAVSGKNEDTSILSDFSSDEAMEGYDLEIFGRRWKFQNVTTMFANQLRSVQVLVPYDSNGLPNFEPLIAESNNDQDNGENAGEQYVMPTDMLKTDMNGQNESGSSSDEPRHTSIRLNGPGSDMLQPTLEEVHAFDPQNQMNEKFAPQTVRCDDFGGNHPAVALQEQDVMARQNFLPIKNDNNVTLAGDMIPLTNLEFKFLCQYCNQGFHQRYKWKNHVQIHIAQTTYKCSCANCGIPYRDYRTMRKHHNERYKKM